MFKQRLSRLSSFLLILLVSSCAATNASSPRVVSAAPVVSSESSTVIASEYLASGGQSNAASGVLAVPAPVEPVETECEVREREAKISEQKRASVLRKLRLANEWHQQGRYTSAKEAYEAVLVEKMNPLSDAYALWGMINLHLDRDNPRYSRKDARLVAHVLRQRARDATPEEGAGEARLLAFSVESMLVADVSKDNVVAENRRLRSELAQREEAIRRLRELTVGR